jgi:hypothetical protein
VKRLTVIYDASCGFCVRCRDWLAQQPTWVELELLWSGSLECDRRFPGLAGPGPAELLAVSDEGAIWRGAHAWLVCLWALKRWRAWSLELATPELLPFSRKAFEVVSASRGWLSTVLGLEPARELRAAIASEAATAAPSASTYRAVARRLEKVRCAYCLEEAAADARTCARCHGTLHSECRDELGRCATLGCAGE